MIEVQPFVAEHLGAINPHDGFPELRDPQRRAALAYGYALAGNAYSIFDRDGRVVFCGGALLIHEEYAQLWSVLAPVRGRLLLAVTGAVQRFLAMRHERRVDTIVRADFPLGQRWVQRLGFRKDGEIEDFFASGAAALLFRLERD